MGQEESTYSEQDGYNIFVKAGDVVASEGPPTHVAIDGAMWVPKGTAVNGKLVTADGPQD